MNGPELREARKAKQMSTQMLADLLGVHRNSVVRWEKGSVIPGPALLSLRWILGKADPLAPRLVPRRTKSEVESEKGAA